jgi:hypothetical protein
MTGGRLLAVLLATIAAGAALAAGPGAGQAPAIPDCAPGAAPIPPPSVDVQGSPASPRVIAGRPFSIEYDPPLGVIVQDTLAPAGTSFQFNDPTGPGVAPTVPAAGPASFAVRFYDANVPEAAACLQRLDFTVNVEVGDLLPGGIGIGEGGFVGRFRKLPARGHLVSGARVIAGTAWVCRSTTALVPVVAELRHEEDLRRRPSQASPVIRIDLPDPCATRAAIGSGPGVRLRYTGGPGVDEGERGIFVEHLRKQGARYALSVSQGGRPLGTLRYYVAFRPQNLGFSATWVIAPEAAFARARCHKPSNSTPLGFRKFPIPACPRR